MRLTAGLDSGPVCLAESVAIEPDDTYGSLAERLQALGGELIVRVLDLAARRRAAARSPSRTSRAPPTRRRSAPRTVCWTRRRHAAELERTVRALHPHIGARLALADGTLLGVHARAWWRWTGADGWPAGCGRARARRRATAVRDRRRSAGAARACNRRAGGRWTPARTCADMPSEARICAYAVLRRVFEDGAYADRALQARGAWPGRARSRAGDAPGLRRGAAPGHARPPDRGARRTSAAAAGRAGAGGAATRPVRAAVPARRPRPRGASPTRCSWPSRGAAGRARPRQRRAASRHARGGGAARRPARRHARAGGGQALPPRVDRPAVVG